MGQLEVNYISDAIFSEVLDIQQRPAAILRGVMLPKIVDYATYTTHVLRR
ncbi:hypothetical protein [Paraburkholderia saeva]|nr:hypothetical protein [Paraburkholderia saeva]